MPTELDDMNRLRVAAEKRIWKLEKTLREIDQSIGSHCMECSDIRKIVRTVLKRSPTLPAEGQSMDELHQTRETLRALVLAVEAKDLHKAFGIFDCPMANAHKLLSDEYLYGSTRDRSANSGGAKP